VTLRSRGFEPAIVYADPHSTFRSMQRDFPGVEVDIGGAKDYVLKVDAKIRRLKEVYRLQWQLPGSLVRDLVAFAVSRINIQRTSALSENIAPRVAFTGMPVQYQKELRFAFGDYVEAYEGSDNTSRPRSTACIALFAIGSSTGSWQLFKIASRSRVRRTLVTSGLIVDARNAIAKEEVEATSQTQGIPEMGDEQQSADEAEGSVGAPVGNPEEIL
jgi:hypothetical protein